MEHLFVPSTLVLGLVVVSPVYPFLVLVKEDYALSLS